MFRAYAVIDGDFSHFCTEYSNIGFRAVLAAQCISKNHTCTGSVKRFSAFSITSIIDCICGNCNCPQLAWVDLRKSPWRLPPSAPIKLIAVYKSSNLGVGLTFADIPRCAVFPVNIWVPAVLRDFLNRDMSIDYVLPKLLDRSCIWHQCCHSNNRNRFEWRLIQSVYLFSVCSGNRHLITPP